MSRGKDERSRAERQLRQDETELWKGITRSIRPLRRAMSTLTNRVSPPEPVTTADTPTRVDPVHASVGEPGPKSTLPLARINRRTKQRLARGTEAIDARLDLHGLTQSEAHRALVRFLRHAQAEGLRFVLVITGKGRGRAHGDSGVLRREVPRWLKLKEFRDYVLGYEAAHIGHGGEGALYVRLRKARSE